MKNQTKVKIIKTTAKVAVLYNDGTSEFRDVELIGKYSLASAKKFIKQVWSVDIEDLKNVEVLTVQCVPTVYSVDTIKLHDFLTTE